MNLTTGCGLVQRRDRVRERRLGRRSRASAPCAAGRSGRCSGPCAGSACCRSWIVGRASRTSGRSCGEERREVLRRGLGRVDQRVEVVERGAQVHERRVGLAQRPRQQPERAGERRRSRRRSPPPWCSRWRPGSARSSRRDGDRGHRLGRVDDEVLEGLLVAVELVDAAGCEVDSAGLKYFAACWTFAPWPWYWAAEPWMTCCRPLRVFGSSVLKSWSRSTGDVVLSVAERRRRRRACGSMFGPGRQRDVAVGDARQRGRADDARSCPRAAARSRCRPRS